MLPRGVLASAHPFLGPVLSASLIKLGRSVSGSGGGKLYHAGRDATGACADHHIGDLGTPEFLALSRGHDGQGCLLQLVRSLEGCRERGNAVRAPRPISLRDTTMGPFRNQEGELPLGSTTGRAWTLWPWVVGV